MALAQRIGVAVRRVAARSGGGGGGAAARRWAHTERIKVLYGSQTGTSMGFANQLADTAPSKSIAADVMDLYEYDAATLPKEAAPVVFLMSCFGRGEPTDSSKKFFKWLDDPARDADGKPLARLKYTVFGLGSSHTHKQLYNVVGRKLDARLEALGATRVFPRGEGDDSGWCVRGATR